MDSKILRKIKKLMALGQSPNTNEAASAMNKAYQLMQEHSLTLSDVEMSTVSEIGTLYMRSHKVNEYEARLSQLISERFGVERLFCHDYKGCKCTFIGIDYMAEIASYVFDVLYRKLAKDRSLYMASLSKRMKRINKTRLSDEYARGWVIAVDTLISKLIPMTEKPAIVNDYMMATHPDIVSKKVTTKRATGQRASMAAMQGYIDGKEVDINAGVSGHTQKQLA